MNAVPLTIQLLRAHRVRLTTGRQLVLDVLLAAPFALSGTEIEQRVPAGVDRATMFRTLRLLEQKQLIHRVPDTAETVRYAATRPAELVAAGPSAAPHAHLKCTVCQHLYCLPHVPVPAVPEAARYQVTRCDCLLLGVCARCQQAAGPAGKV